MITTLKKRPRADNASNEYRRSSANAGRAAYLGLLIVFALFGANYFWGGMVFLRADGLVLRNQSVIAATYLAEVEQVAVRQGQEVRAGDVLLRLKSFEIAERLAALSAQHADLVQRVAEFDTRALVATELAPLARRREAESGAALRGLETLAQDGLATTAEWDETLRALHDSQELTIRYDAETNAHKRNTPAVERARRTAEAALSDLMRYYEGGKVRAPVDGSVGAAAPSPGEVYRPGDLLLTIYSGPPYCLIYLPNEYLFPIRKGMRVVVRNGRRAASGEISDILPVSAALPKEFQKTFRPQDRGQLAKIRFAGPSPFSVGEKVRISLIYRPWRIADGAPTRPAAPKPELRA